MAGLFQGSELLEALVTLFSSGLGLWVLLVGLVYVLWLLVPFAVFGTKRKIDGVVDAIADLSRAQRELAGEIRRFLEPHQKADESSDLHLQASDIKRQYRKVRLTEESARSMRDQARGIKGIP